MNKEGFNQFLQMLTPEYRMFAANIILKINEMEQEQFKFKGKGKA